MFRTVGRPSLTVPFSFLPLFCFCLGGSGHVYKTLHWVSHVCLCRSLFLRRFFPFVITGGSAAADNRTLCVAI